MSANELPHDGKELLRLEGIRKRFGSVEVLKGIDLSVNSGEFITLLGSSGCGKTTTLRIIAGLEQADSGRVLIAGQDVSGLDPNRRDVHMVFQNYALFPHMNVAANIAYSLRVAHRPKPEIKEAVAEALALVRLSGYGGRMPGELSGGERQRVAVARAIVGRPKLLLLDEPLGALDLQLRRQMQTELKRLQKQLGITFIYITHDQEEALTMSDRIAVMRDGRFEQTGTAPQIYDLPRTSYVARFVGNANIINGRLASRIKENGREILVLENSGGTALVAHNGGGIADGRELTLAVRSEYVNMTAAAPSSADISPDTGSAPSGVNAGHGLDAAVEDKSFAGGQLSIAARLKNGGIITASRHGIDSPLTIGQEVRISWHPENAVLVDLDPYGGETP